MAPVQYEKLGEGFKLDMNKSLDHRGDDMPPLPNEGKRRTKFGHQQGLIAPVKWVPRPD